MGIYLDPHLKFNCHIKTLADSGGRALGSLLSKFKHLKDVTYKTYTIMYASQIPTIRDYCSSVWAHTKASECDFVQNRDMRYFLGVHRFTPVPALNGKMGCKFKRYLCAIRFWNRLQKMDNCRLTKVVFLWDLKNLKSNWSENVKNIFRCLDMTEDFMHQKIVNLKIVKSKLFNVAEKAWRGDMKSKPKLRN